MNADGRGLLYTEKLSPEYTMRLTWKMGFFRLLLTGGIIWMLIILTVLCFHIWSCQSSVAFFSGELSFFMHRKCWLYFDASINLKKVFFCCQKVSMLKLWSIELRIITAYGFIVNLLLQCAAL